MVSQSIPEPVDADGEDVRWALTTAQRLASTGEPEAAARWLRRAVSAALEQQRIERATELDRAAQLFENEFLSGDAAVPSTERGDGMDAKAPTPRARALAPTMQDIATNPQTVASPDAPESSFEMDDEATVVSTPHEVAVATESTLRLQAVTAAPRSEIPDVSAPPSTDHESTVVSRPAVRDTLQELRIPEGLRDEGAAVSSETMTSFSRFRVALLASSDDQPPRVISLRPDEAPPAGAGVGYLVPDSDEDREAIAILLGIDER